MGNIKTNLCPPIGNWNILIVEWERNEMSTLAKNLNQNDPLYPLNLLSETINSKTLGKIHVPLSFSSKNVACK
jgi:hypothetical protein